MTPRLVDVDADARARALKAFAWSTTAGLFMGIGVGVQMGLATGLIVGLATAILGGGGAVLLSELAGVAASQLAHPSVGERPKGLSRAEALRMKGELREAVEELEGVVYKNPEDPEAYFLLARLFRDDRGDLDSAAVWFRRARDRAKLSEGLERQVYRELISVLRRIDEPRAAPELARMAARFEGTQEGAWARAELTDIKRRMRAADQGP